MQCQCGAATIDRVVVEKKVIVLEYAFCKGCGRTYIAKAKRRPDGQK